MRLLYFCCLFVLLSAGIFGQCPAPHFAPLPNACTGTPITFSNTTVGSNLSYTWDFSAGDLALAPVTDTYTITTTSAFAGYTMVYDSGNYYGFASTYANAKIVRLDFGPNVDNPTPTETVISTGANIASPIGMDMVYDTANAKWYCFVASYGGGIYRIDFDNGLSVAPTAYTLVAPEGNGMVHVYDVKVRKDGGDYYGFVGGLNVTDIYKLNFNTNLLATALVPTPMNISGLASPCYLSVNKFCDTWVMLVTSYYANTLSKITFTSNLNSPTNPASYISCNVGSIYTYGVDMVEEGCNIYAFVSNKDGGLYQLNFGNNISNAPTSTTLSNTFFNYPQQLKIINHNSLYRVFCVSQSATTDNLSRFKFPDYSSANFTTYTSNVLNPTNIFYTQPGTYTISLTATDTLTGAYASYCDNITVVAHDTAAFNVPVVTCSNAITFMDLSYPGPIAAWHWDFGDGNTSNASTINYTYSTPGNYLVTLTITSANGCMDTATQIAQANKPVAGFTFVDGCVAAVQFTDTSHDSSNLIDFRQWDFGDLSTSTAQNPSHQYAASGTYIVTLTVGINGCTSSSTHTVHFYALPNAAYSVANTCLGVPSQFTNLSTCLDSFTSYWGFGDSFHSILQSPAHTYTATGTYHDTLIVTSLPWGCIDTLFNIVTVSVPSVISVTHSPNFICGVNPVIFTDNTLIIPDNYLWDFGVTPQVVSAIDTPTYTFGMPGTYNVKLVAITGTSCKDSAFDVVIVANGPNALFKFDSVCLGGLTSLIDLSTRATASDSIISWKWSFNDSLPVSRTDSLFHHTFLNCGMNLVIDTVTTVAGCIGVDTHSIRVYCPPTAGFSYANRACNTTPVIFTDTSHAGSGNSIINWQWNFGDSSPFDTNQNPHHTYSQAGHDTIYLTITSDQGCTGIDSGYIDISAGPIPHFSNSNSNICLGDVVNFTDYSLPFGLISTWAWNFADPISTSLNTSTIPNPSHQFDSAGIFKITLTVTQVIDTVLTCSSSLTQSLAPINVHFRPHASFVDSNLCVGQAVLFTSTSTMPMDTIFHDVINWSSWTTGTQHNFGDTAHFIFPNAGTDTMKLVVQTAFCSDSIRMDTVIIHPAPTSYFTYIPDGGKQFTFTDSSQNYTSNSWNFGDSTALVTLFNPVHIFNNDTCNVVTLNTANGFGCRATSSQVICLNKTLLDIAVENLSETIAGNWMKVSAVVANRGSELITNFDVEVNVGGSKIAIPFTKILDGGDTMNFQQMVVINPHELPKYLCVKAENPNGISPDAMPVNDEKCLDLSQQLLVFDLYPNPTLNNITVDIIVPLSSEIVISVYDILGQQVQVLYDGITVEGFNQFTFDVQTLAVASYLLTVDFRDERVVKKFNKF